MNYRRAFILNAVIYITTGLLAAEVLALSGNPISLDVPPIAPQIFVAMVIGTILTLLGAWWFFRTEPRDLRYGLYFWLIALVGGFILDGVLSLVLTMTGRNPWPLIETSYTHWYFGVMLIVSLGSVLMIARNPIKQ